MSARRVKFYSAWATNRRRCTHCGWTGTGKDASAEHFADLFELRCPTCDASLATITHPTPKETREAAAAGNAEAIKNLANLDDLDRERAQHAKSRRGRDRLPDLDGDALEFTFHPDGGTDGMNPTWLVLTCGGEEIHRERSGFEHWRAIIDVGEKVLARYPGRVAWIDPGAAGDCLGGDYLGYWDKIGRFLADNHVAPLSGNWAQPPAGSQ